MNSPKKTNLSDYGRVAEALQSSQRVFAVTHINPDGDALGSLCFFRLLLLKLDKSCTIYCAGPMPASLEFLPGFKDIITDISKIDLPSFDCLVSLDCATPKRTAIEKNLHARHHNQVFIEIDHHQIIPSSADIILRIPEAASTTQILAELANEMNVSVDKEMAQALLTGIVTDTANFVHASSSSDTMDSAAKLVGQGANLSRINDLTTRTKTVPDLKLWGIALSRLTRNEKYDLVWTILSSEDLKSSKAGVESLEGIAGFLGGLDAKAILVIYDLGDGTIRGSFRTTRSNINVARLAQYLGGGGHRQAAGFSMPGRLVSKNGEWTVVI